jgi:hypothetical protein
MALIASNFRSTCGPERGAPENSTQRFPAAAPHVGQGTEDDCLGVSSFFFILTEYLTLGRETVQCWTLLHKSLLARGGGIFSVWHEVNLIVQDDTEERRIYVEPAVVLDEAQFSEFVHEKIYA